MKYLEQPKITSYISLFKGVFLKIKIMFFWGFFLQDVLGILLLVLSLCPFFSAGSRNMHNETAPYWER